MAVMTDPEMLSWLRKMISQRLYLAQHAIELGNNAEWVEQSSGVLVTSEPTETDAWHGTWLTGDSSLTRLMEANDPQDTIARCEAELAILDEHRLILADRGYHDHADHRLPQQYRVVDETPDSQAIGRANMMQYDVDCHACHRRWPCRTILLLAAGYRHHPGWLPQWAPESAERA